MIHVCIAPCITVGYLYEVFKALCCMNHDISLVIRFVDIASRFEILWHYLASVSKLNFKMR